MVSVGVHRKGKVSFLDLLDAIKAHPERNKAGAIGCFIGVVRGIAEGRKKVVKLEYEAHGGLAERELLKIAEEVMRHPGIVDITIHHVVDTVKPGEDILYVLVLGEHRREVFWGVSKAVDELKKRAPIWKKEYTTEGSYWVTTKGKDPR
ncbi:MAG: molybdenum cofactor biosynthesis protein MoaE [Candidatus Bathyarchaeia archaeon]